MRELSVIHCYGNKKLRNFRASEDNITEDTRYIYSWIFAVLLGIGIDLGVTTISVAPYTQTNAGSIVRPLI
jgi:hypothetical protein